MDDAKRSLDWPLISFFALAYLIAWACVPLLASFANSAGVEDWVIFSDMIESWDYDDIEPTAPKWLLYLITRVQDFSFSIAGVTLIFYTAGKQGLNKLGTRLLQWRIGWPWLAAALIPVGLYFLATLVAGAVGSFDFNMANLRLVLFSFESGLLVTLFLRGPMGEELGLRGFALPRLLSRMSAIRASTIIGFFWALWHLPVLLSQNIFSLVVFLLLAFVLSFVFTWLFISTNGSLIPVLIFHATQNTEEVFEVLFPALVGTDWELTSSMGLLVLGVVAAVLLYRSALEHRVQGFKSG